MTALSRRWLVCLQSMGTRSGLMSEALQSANPNLHLIRVLKKYAPSTLSRYFAEWDMWCTQCQTLSCRPESPLSGVLPDWLATRASSQGLATGPVRAVAFLACRALELSAMLQPALVKSFLVATAPSERRGSLPLPLSFVVWCLPNPARRSALCWLRAVLCLVRLSLGRLCAIPSDPPARPVCCGGRRASQQAFGYSFPARPQANRGRYTCGST